MLDLISDAEDIIEFIGRDTDHIAVVLIVASLLLVFRIGITAYNGKLVKYITHPRNAWKFICLLLIFALVAFLRYKGIISNLPLIILTLLWVELFLISFKGMKRRTFANFRNTVVHKYEKKLYQGFAIEFKAFVDPKTHWYLITAEDKLEYQMLRCMYYVELGEFGLAYKALESIEDSWMYDEEVDYISLESAMLLLMMGSMNAAIDKIETLSDEIRYKHPVVSFLYGYKYENEGDIDKALENVQKARDIVDAGYKMPDWKKGEIYNNYSRIAIITGNKTEALRYIKIAWSKVKDSGDMRMISIVAQNLVLQMAIYGESNDECVKAIKEYRDLIKGKSYINQIEYYNTLILYYRQVGDEKRAYEIIKDSYIELIENLETDRAALLTASTFRMLFNGKYEYRWFDPYARTIRKKFEELSVRTKLVIYREFMAVFDQGEFKVISSKRPYLGIKNKILKYYREKAIKEIEEEIEKTESYEVFKYKGLVLEKLFVLRHIEGKNHINKSQGQYLDLYDQLYKNGLHIDAVNVLMTLVEECKSPDNLIVWIPIWPTGVYFSDLLNMIPVAPEPLHNNDGYHMDYYQLNPMPFAKVMPVHRATIEENIRTIIDEYHKWANHPFKLDLCLGIGHMLMCLDRRDEAKEYYEFYKNSGQSESQLTAWARNDYHMLAVEFGDKTIG